MSSSNKNANDQQDYDPHEPVAQLRPLLNAISEHGPIFRRELFDAAYAEYLKLNEDDIEKPVDGQMCSYLANKATLLDIYGAPHKCRILKPKPFVEKDGKILESERCWTYSSLQSLSYHSIDGGSERLIPFAFGTCSHGGKEIECLASTQVQDDMALWRKEWEASEFHRRLCAFLENAVGVGKTRPIRKIICFGLACPLSSWERSRRRSYVQHLAAHMIREIITSKQSGQKPLIYAQDPTYCPEAVTYLQKEFDMTVLKDPDGFKCLDGNTFIISVAPNVPVRQIVIDMTDDTKGPAGMLCDMLEGDWLDFEGKVQWSDGKGKVCWYTTDPGSPALSRYKRESIALEYSDKEEEKFFGAMGLYLKRPDC